MSGEGATVDVSNPDLKKDDEVIILPIIVGETDQLQKIYTCGDDYGVPATVI